MVFCAAVDRINLEDGSHFFISLRYAYAVLARALERVTFWSLVSYSMKIPTGNLDIDCPLS